MKRHLFAALTLGLSLSPQSASAAVAAPDTSAGNAEAPATAVTDSRVERGAYLVTVGGCNDCHTPWHLGPNGPEPDRSRLLSGHPQQLVMPPAPALPEGPWTVTAAATNTAWAGPWGVSFTANLTPDAETGTGAWSEQDFLDTLRSGRHLGRGRQILPPMPWFNYAEMTDEDLGAIYAYLRTVPPIANRVPDPVPPMPAH
jgi:mono/diheme cytochrome c family protein